MFRRLAPQAPRFLAARARLPRTPAVAAGVRFATSDSKVPETPVPLYGLDGTYASALYLAAAKDSSIDGTEKSLLNLRSLLEKDPRTAAILGDPALDVKEKKEAIKIVLEHVQADKTVKSFLDVLADNARLDLLEDIIGKYQILSNAHRGVVIATVTSAQPLDAATLKKLDKIIAGSKMVGKGKSLEIKNVVDPAIRGGLTVTIGDRTVDASVGSKIVRYNQLLTQSV